MKKIIDTERISFFKDFILNPSKIGSVTPSSSYLTQSLLGSLPWDRLHTIIELGAGTGVFTEFVIDTTLSDQGIFVAFQYSLQMYRTFHRIFPSVNIGFTLLNLPPAFTYNCHK
mgnify:CR=1 FL=1